MTKMKIETRRLLEDFLTHQEYKLDEAQRAWDTAARRTSSRQLIEKIPCAALA